MTPRRIELLLERRRAIMDSGLTLWQMEKLSYLDEYNRSAFTEWQRWLWRHVIGPIGAELGEEGYDQEEDDEPDEYA